MPADYLQRIVNLERRDYDTIQPLAPEKGLGKKGFSTALRIIIREWQDLKSRVNITNR